MYASFAGVVVACSDLVSNEWLLCVLRGVMMMALGVVVVVRVAAAAGVVIVVEVVGVVEVLAVVGVVGEEGGGGVFLTSSWKDFDLVCALFEAASILENIVSESVRVEVLLGAGGGTGETRSVGVRLVARGA